MEQDYLRNVNLSIQWNRWLLTPLDVWPNARKNSCARRCLSGLIGTICYCLISFEFVSCFMFVVAEQENVKGKIRLVGPLIFFAMTFVKYFLLTFHEDDIRECIERIKWDWKHARYLEDRNIMISYANYGRKLATICTFFVYCSFAFYYLIRPISMGRTVIEEENLTFIPMAFPFPKLIADVRYSPANEIVYFIQCLTGVLIHLITAAACSLAAVFAVHACGQMKVLTIWLEHLVDGRSDTSDTVDERIASIVGQHVRILKFLALTEKALQQISFVEFVGCTVVLCLIGYYIIMEWSENDIASVIINITLLSSFVFNIFIFCYIGELVADQCEKIGEATYMIEWYQLSGNKKLCCILFIAMSNSSIKFTAGNMVELSINTFSNVVKTSVAFFNMLRAMM
ncbi:odorant receptor 43a-like [Xylocopa sonorina]|uniref:odorant receptor 43a-like n=1 Tax=Xylocopa sonorina TaxID=1818115 RepID=UPI00403AAA8A